MIKQHKLPMIDADVVLYSDFFDSEECDRIFAELQNTIHWRQDKIKLFGKEYDQPRLVAWYGDAGKTYTYSNISMAAIAWTPTLIEIRDRIHQVTEVRFNSVLINYYRHGRDSMSWHSDDEAELGRNPAIASVSFGAERVFHFRHRAKPEKMKVPLPNGSLLMMQGETQHFWQHQIPKTNRAIAPRINLTFRAIRSWSRPVDISSEMSTGDKSY
jgi:alkylated DNA repair dioxygenase AlkB